MIINYSLNDQFYIIISSKYFKVIFFKKLKRIYIYKIAEPKIKYNFSINIESIFLCMLILFLCTTILHAIFAYLSTFKNHSYV